MANGARKDETILLTGATGFIGGLLLDRLLEAGHKVRAVSRRPASELGLPEHENLEVMQGNVLDAEECAPLFRGVARAFYLIHSMEGGIGEEEAFVERDREAALNFGRAAAEEGLSQIIYVSGLEPDEFVSDHLQSRNDVERYLADYGVPVTVLRAGFIIGAESAGFQMMRGITDHMTTMTVPTTFHHRTQPAYVADVVEALALCAEHPDKVRARVFEVGSREVVEYLDVLKMFGEVSGRTMNFIEIPWIPNTIAATFIATVSKLPYALIAALIQGLKVDLFVTDESLYEIFPSLKRTPPLEAMKSAWAKSEIEAKQSA